MMTLLLLACLQEKPDLEKTKLYVYDSTKGMTFKLMKDGTVEVTLIESEPGSGEKSSRTLTAPSWEEFRRKNPEVVRKYDLDRYAGPRRPAAPDDLDQLFRDFRRGIPEMPAVPRFDPFDADIEKWMEEQRKYMEDLRRRFRGPAPVPPPAVPPAPAPSGPEFGVKVEPVEETLRDQLSLKEGEGVMAGEVKPGSVAEKAGLKKHDIILKLDGAPVGDTWGFRKDVLKALERPEFELEILRSGKRETLKAKPGVRKDE